MQARLKRVSTSKKCQSVLRTFRLHVTDNILNEDAKIFE